MDKKRGRPRDGSQRKEPVSLRLQPKIKKKLINDFGSIQIALDYIIAAFYEWDDSVQ